MCWNMSSRYVRSRPLQNFDEFKCFISHTSWTIDFWSIWGQFTPIFVQWTRLAGVTCVPYHEKRSTKLKEAMPLWDPFHRREKLFSTSWMKSLHLVNIIFLTMKWRKKRNICAQHVTILSPLAWRGHKTRDRSLALQCEVTKKVMNWEKCVRGTYHISLLCRSIRPKNDAKEWLKIYKTENL